MSTTSKTIWCLFEGECYENHLRRWWSEKPSIQTLASYLCLSMNRDEDISIAAAIWNGHAVEAYAGNTYRLTEVFEGSV
jgi:hypothetical protein